MDNDYLAHYGVLGMKWGVRKSGKKPSGRKSKKKKKINYENDARGYNLSAKNVQKNMHKMTDAELQKSINRLNMQKAVNKMNPTTMQKGRNAVKTYAATLGTVIGAVVITKKATQGVGKALNSIGDMLMPRIYPISSSVRRAAKGKYF